MNTSISELTKTHISVSLTTTYPEISQELVGDQNHQIQLDDSKVIPSFVMKDGPHDKSLSGKKKFSSYLSIFKRILGHAIAAITGFALVLTIAFGYWAYEIYTMRRHIFNGQSQQQVQHQNGSDNIRAGITARRPMAFL